MQYFCISPASPSVIKRALEWKFIMLTQGHYNGKGFWSGGVMNKRFLTTISMLVFALGSIRPAIAENSCPNINLPCSCIEAMQIFEAGVENNPYLIETIDFDNTDANIDETCLSALKVKLGEEGIEFTTIYTNPPLGIRFTVPVFLDFIKNVFERKGVKIFPVSSKDISSQSICLPAGVSKAQAAKPAIKLDYATLPAIQNIDGINGIDTTKIPDCLVYLPKQFVSNTAAPNDYEFHPQTGSSAISYLIASGNKTLAKGIIDSFIFEIEKMGYPVYKNRGRFLSQSENNFIVTNFEEYFEATKDFSWLEKQAIPAAEKIIEYWNTRIGTVPLGTEEEDLTGHRWFTSGAGPIEDVWGTGPIPDTYYYKVLYSLTKLALTPDPLRLKHTKGFDYNRVIRVASKSTVDIWESKKGLKPVTIEFDDARISKDLAGNTYILSAGASATKKDEPVIKLNNVYYSLTPTYFSNDRSARVSGYFPSYLYGPWNAFTDEYIDAALNLELYRANVDLAKMYAALSTYYKNIDKKKAKTFEEMIEVYNFEAGQIKEVIFKYLLDNKTGMVFNYNTHTHLKATYYPFAGGAYALWARLFDLDNDIEIKMLVNMANYLAETLESPSGILGSGVETGLRWDKPRVHPAQQTLIVRGLKDYAAMCHKKGLAKEANKLEQMANRIALKFLKMNFKDWVSSKGAPMHIDTKLGSTNEELTTGFRANLNYIQNVIAILDLYNGLDAKGKNILADYAVMVGVITAN